MRNSSEVGLDDLSSAAKVALLGRISPSVESSYFNKTEDYVKGLIKRVVGDDG